MFETHVKISRLKVIGIIGALVVVAIGLHVSLRAESDRVQPIRITAKLMPPFLRAVTRSRDALRLSVVWREIARRSSRFCRSM